MQLYTSAILTQSWEKVSQRMSSEQSLLSCNSPKLGRSSLAQLDVAGHKDFPTRFFTVFGTNKLRSWR